MPNQNRGVIRNVQYATEWRDFSGLCYDTITPTDVDLLLDFKNRLFVFGEAKYGDNQMPCGQRLAIERTVDAIQSSGIPAVGIIAQHHTTNNLPIDMANCIVTEIRFKGQWKDTKTQPTVREVIDYYLQQYVPDFWEALE